MGTEEDVIVANEAVTLEDAAQHERDLGDGESE